MLIQFVLFSCFNHHYPRKENLAKSEETCAKTQAPQASLESMSKHLPILSCLPNFSRQIMGKFLPNI